MNSYPGPLGQIINNFVNNALLHGFDGHVEGNMSLTARLAGAAEVEICFADTGRGMAPEHLKRIFDPFFTTRLGQGGSGLGLNIVYNQVTHILGGSVEVSSELGKGTQFTLRLPLLAPEHAEAAV
jgi:signal transduction histidine kinase